MLRQKLANVEKAWTESKESLRQLMGSLNLAHVTNAVIGEREQIAKFLLDISHANAHTKPEAAEALADAAFRVKRLEHK